MAHIKNLTTFTAKGFEMASIKFRIRKSAKDPASIKVIVSEGRKNTLEMKTGYVLNKDQWSFSKAIPKQNSADAKNIRNQLLRLQELILSEYNKAQDNGQPINKIWLSSVLDKHFKRKPIVDLPDSELKDINETLKNQIQYIIDTASSRQIKGSNRIGLSKGRLQNYHSFLKIIKTYEEHIESTIFLKDLSASFTENFKQWLLDYKEYSVNYAGKQIGNLRAVARDAKKRGYRVHDHVNHIQAFAESNSDRSIITLSFDELETIRKTPMPERYLENAKKWLLLGCHIGQRGGDLLNLTKENIRYMDDQPVIDLIQQKTKKEVTIPISSEFIKNEILSDFPHRISNQKLNEYIKKVCKIAEIDAPTYGKIRDHSTNRNVSGHYPKYKLITSHCFRRSFATNYYKKVPTPVLMGITGHSKEQVFLNYINRQEDKDENAKLFLKYIRD